MYLAEAAWNFIVVHVYAQSSSLDSQLQSNYYTKLQPIQGSQTIGQLVTTVIDIILYVAGALAVIYLLYAAIMYITSAGEEAAAEKGRKGIINAVIGIVVILLAFVIEKAVARVVAGV